MGLQDSFIISLFPAAFLRGHVLVHQFLSET